MPAAALKGHVVVDYGLQLGQYSLTLRLRWKQKWILLHNLFRYYC